MEELVCGDARLILGDCREVIPTIGRVSHTISDPPYDAVMQDAFARVADVSRSLRGPLEAASKREELTFAPIDAMRSQVCQMISDATDGWAILFTIAEGVQAWRDALQAAGARYKRAMVWIKPDAMPQFNGQGPSIGHEMLVSAWCGVGYSKWNGGGRPGTFYHTKERDRVHPTQKPLPLMMELISLFSNPGDVILDPFMGSGTTGIAAVTLGRKFIGIERDVAAFAAAKVRFEQHSTQFKLFTNDQFRQGNLFEAEKKQRSSEKISD